MSKPEPNYPTTESPENSNTTKTQYSNKKGLKLNFMKTIEALKTEVNKSLKEIRKMTNTWRYE